LNPPPQPGPPDDGGSPPGGVSWGKAAVLLIVAVLVGILMLHAISQTPAALPVSAATTTTTTTTGHTSTSGHGTTTTSSTVPKSSVKVLAANGTNTKGAAEFFTQKLQAKGWTLETPVDTTTNVNASNVYYASGQQAAAAQVAQSLGLKESAVQPLTTSVPVQGATGVDVVVVVGPDLGTQVTTTTG